MKNPHRLANSGAITRVKDPRHGQRALGLTVAALVAVLVIVSIAAAACNNRPAAAAVVPAFLDTPTAPPDPLRSPLQAPPAAIELTAVATIRPRPTATPAAFAYMPAAMANYAAPRVCAAAGRGVGVPSC